MDLYPSPIWGEMDCPGGSAFSTVDLAGAAGRLASSSGGKRGRGDSPSGGSTPTGKRRAVGVVGKSSNSPVYYAATPRRVKAVSSATPSPAASAYTARLSRLAQGPTFEGVNTFASARLSAGGRKRKGRLSDPPLNIPGLFSSPGESPSYRKGRGSRTVPDRGAVSLDVVRMNFSAGAVASGAAASALPNAADGTEAPRDPVASSNAPAADEYSRALATYLFRSDAVSVEKRSVLSGQLQDARFTASASTTRVKKRGLFAVAPPAPQARGGGLSPPSLCQPPGRLRGVKKHTSIRKNASRSIPQVADRVLDAPCIVDDYRLTLIDWSSWVNVLAVCLTDTLYTWDASTGESSEVMNLDNESDAISCVSWMPESVVLSLGTTQTGAVKLWDVQRGKQLREMGGHSDRVCTIAWNQATVTTGSRDGLILHHDVRVKKHLVAKLGAPHSPHESEICKVLYNQEGTAFAAADDAGVVSLWDTANTREPVQVFNLHNGPVKAMSWVPNRRHMLCTGGYDDQTLKITKTTTGDVLTSSFTGSEITSLLWSANSDELVTTGGHPTNSIAIWSHAKSEKLEKVAEVRGHKYVIHSSAPL